MLLTVPTPTPSTSGAVQSVSAPADTAAGAVSGSIATSALNAGGKLQANWSNTASTVFHVESASTAAATVTNAQGATVGSGPVELSASAGTTLTVSGAAAYNVNGAGSLSFYGPAESSLGVSGNWTNYSATVTGNVSLTITTDRLTLNGQTLPAGTYTIATTAAALSGSGPSSSPNFSGSASITASGATLNFGPATGTLTSGGDALDTENGGTLTGYSGTVTVAAGGNNADSLTLSGAAAHVLTIADSPSSITTDQNTPATFTASLHTNLADTYSLAAQAPLGWSVAIDAAGNVNVTPAPGLQGGTYPIQILAQSATDPDLFAQAIINVTVAPTTPGMTLAVQPDPLLTVPFDGAQVPSAFQSQMQNLGPAADTYDLTFSNVPAGFTVLDSGASVTVPPGQMGILGIYLQPTSKQLPPPGTQESFTVTATSTTNPAITQTKTVTFTIPEIDAVTASVSPAAVSTTPGNTVTPT
ncbi:MAG TPA: hypothetical protein PK867_11995, partial [Pirellulales bacterium]|nr:hypothetical protein [Pirellulales bacterium]